MATKIPPHNVTELINGLTALIDNSELTAEELMNYVKGPDFPTGAIIMGTEGIKSAYNTGRGKVIVRGRAFVETKKNGREHIIIS